MARSALRLDNEKRSTKGHACVVFNQTLLRNKLIRYNNMRGNLRVYTQIFNRRHSKVGHLFRGRFKAILVHRDAYLLGRPVGSAADRRRAADRYARLVARVPDASLWDGALRQQIYLGDEAFVARMQALGEPRNSTDADIPKIQRRKARTLTQWLGSCETREEALYKARTDGAITMSAIARELGLSVCRVSRLIARSERATGKARARRRGLHSEPCDF